MQQPTWNRRLLLGLTLFIATVPLAAQDWAGKARVSGRVEDADGNPVAGASVSLRQNVSDPASGPEPFETDKAGRWSYLGLDGGIWAIVIEAQGFLPSQGQFQANPFQPTVIPTIVLERNPSAAIEEGDVLMQSQDFEAARARYLEALPGLDEVGQAQVRVRIGNTYLSQGNYATARSEYQQAMPDLEADQQPQLQLLIGNTYHLEGNYEAARNAYRQALPFMDTAGKADLLLMIAKGFDSSGDRKAAISTLKEALEIDPGNENMIQILADLLTREGLEDEAREYLKQLPEGVTLPADLVLNIGIRLYNEGNMAEAKDYFDQTVSENPDLGDAYYYRGLTNLSLGENEAALADFQRLLEIDPENSHRAEVEEFIAFLESGE